VWETGQWSVDRGIGRVFQQPGTGALGGGAVASPSSLNIHVDSLASGKIRGAGPAVASCDAGHMGPALGLACFPVTGFERVEVPGVKAEKDLHLSLADSDCWLAWSDEDHRELVVESESKDLDFASPRCGETHKGNVGCPGSAC